MSKKKFISVAIILILVLTTLVSCKTSQEEVNNYVEQSRTFVLSITNAQNSVDETLSKFIETKAKMLEDGKDPDDIEAVFTEFKDGDAFQKTIEVMKKTVDSSENVISTDLSDPPKECKKLHQLTIDVFDVFKEKITLIDSSDTYNDDFFSSQTAYTDETAELLKQITDEIDALTNN